MLPLDPTISLNEAVYRSLRYKVMIGQIKPGENLTLRGISADFEVSMTPVRESIRRLVAEGALTMSLSGRISAPELNNDRIEELASLRSLLEPELATRAMPRVHDALIERLSVINSTIDQMIVKQNAIGYIQKNIEFHKTLYLRAQAPAMLALLEAVWLQSGPTMRSLYEKMLRNQNTINHKKILAALKAGDEPGLRLSIRTDVTRGLHMLLA